MMFLNNKKLFAQSFIVLCLVITLCLTGLSVLAADTCITSVSSPVKEVTPGEQFTINIIVEPNNPIAGAQFNMIFNPSLVTVNNVSKGNLFSKNNASTYFIPGTINNSSGTITGVAEAIIGTGQTISESGILAVITMTAGSTLGSCPLNLSSVIIGDVNGQPLLTNMINGNITIANMALTNMTAASTTPAMATTPLITTSIISARTTSTIDAVTPTNSLVNYPDSNTTVFTPSDEIIPYLSTTMTNNLNLTELPTLGLSLMAMVIGCALLLITITVAIILARRRKLIHNGKSGVC
jgi:hypothetical protein